MVEYMYVWKYKAIIIIIIVYKYVYILKAQFKGTLLDSLHVTTVLGYVFVWAD